MNDEKATTATENLDKSPQLKAMESVVPSAQEATPESAQEISLEEKPAAASQLTIEQIAELESKAAKAQENWDRYLRVAADLENYKKRAAREKQDAARYANESILSRLVPVLDTFDMALSAAASNQGTTLDSLKTGITMIRGQLKSALDDAGLEEVDATGKPFDPNWHEAVSQQECADVPEGQVVQQLRKGYKYRERLLRPASVVVAKAPATPAS
jgi:molecular chaperone GrpE